MSFTDLMAHHRRLSLLRLLAEAPENTLNDAILHSALGELGLAASRDQVKSDLAWLAEQGLATVETVGHLAVATLSQRGDDVASGRVTHPGVKRPSPRS